MPSIRIETYTDWSTTLEDVGNPVAFPFFDGCLNIDEFVRRMSGEGTRRIGSGSPRVLRRAAADDREKPRKPTVDLVLYISPESDKSRRAIRAVQDVLKQYDAAQIRFSMCDLSQRPQDGEADSVVFTPTLVKQGPGPRTSIIGNLERQDVLCDLLDASGVARRWDD